MDIDNTIEHQSTSDKNLPTRNAFQDLHIHWFTLSWIIQQRVYMTHESQANIAIQTTLLVHAFLPLIRSDSPIHHIQLVETPKSPKPLSSRISLYIFQQVFWNTYTASSHTSFPWWWLRLAFEICY